MDDQFKYPTLNDTPPPGKTRITIRLDNQIVAWFKKHAERQGGGSYQSLINDALLKHIDNQDSTLEETIRLAIREEMAVYMTSINKFDSEEESEEFIEPPDLTDENPFKGIIGIFDSGHPDTAEQAEEISENDDKPNSS